MQTYALFNRGKPYADFTPNAEAKNPKMTVYMLEEAWLPNTPANLAALDDLVQRLCRLEKFLPKLPALIEKKKVTNKTGGSRKRKRSVQQPVASAQLVARANPAELAVGGTALPGITSNMPDMCEGHLCYGEHIEAWHPGLHSSVRSTTATDPSLPPVLRARTKQALYSPIWAAEHPVASAPGGASGQLAVDPSDPPTGASSDADRAVPDDVMDTLMGDECEWWWQEALTLFLASPP